MPMTRRALTFALPSVAAFERAGAAALPLNPHLALKKLGPAAADGWTWCHAWPCLTVTPG